MRFHVLALLDTNNFSLLLFYRVPVQCQTNELRNRQRSLNANRTPVRHICGEIHTGVVQQ